MVRRERDRVDPVTFEIVHAALLSVTDEMGGALRRSSYSPIIREMQDYSCALFDARGRLVVQGDFIPAQLGAMSLVVQAIVEQYGSALAPGDVFISNDPYTGGAHTPDVNVVRPVFVPERGGRHARLVAFTGTVAHQVDFGGRNPGTEGADNRQLFEEGLILPPLRLYRGGLPEDQLFALIAANVRDPVSTLADLRAEAAACLAGEGRVLEIIEERGLGAIEAVFALALAEAARRTRIALASLADGMAEAEGWMDDDGADGPPVRIHVRLTKRGSMLEVDLSGTPGQVPAGINVPWASTRACVAFLLKTITGPDTIHNDGTLDPVTIVCPEGSLLRPRHPAAVSVRHLTCQRLADVLIQAGGQLAPELRVGSSWVGFFSLMAEGISPRTGRPVVIQDVVGGGTGAHGPRAGGGARSRPGAPGLDGVDTYMSNVALLPAETCEVEYPWRLVRSELIKGSEGRGRFRGGRGLRRTYLVLGDGPQAVVLYAEQTSERWRPRGAAGGGDGTPTRLEVRDADGRTHDARSKSTLVLQPGSTVTIETGGGGGWGMEG